MSKKIILVALMGTLIIGVEDGLAQSGQPSPKLKKFVLPKAPQPTTVCTDDGFRWSAPTGYPLGPWHAVGLSDPCLASEGLSVGGLYFGSSSCDDGFTVSSGRIGSPPVTIPQGWNGLELNFKTMKELGGADVCAVIIQDMVSGATEIVAINSAGVYDPQNPINSGSYILNSYPWIIDWTVSVGNAWFWNTSNGISVILDANDFTPDGTFGWYASDFCFSEPSVGNLTGAPEGNGLEPVPMTRFELVPSVTFSPAPGDVVTLQPRAKNNETLANAFITYTVNDSQSYIFPVDPTAAIKLPVPASMPYGTTIACVSVGSDSNGEIFKSEVTTLTVAPPMPLPNQGQAVLGW